jgi:hypothetical protein
VSELSYGNSLEQDRCYGNFDAARGQTRTQSFSFSNVNICKKVRGLGTAGNDSNEIKDIPAVTRQLTERPMFGFIYLVFHFVAAPAGLYRDLVMSLKFPTAD